MKPEDVKSFLNSPEGLELKESIIADSISGLKNSRDTILGEKKDLAEKFNELEKIHTDYMNQSKQELINKNEKIKNDAVDKIIVDYGIGDSFSDLFKLRLDKESLSIGEDNSLLIGAEDMKSFMESFKDSGEIKKFQPARIDNGGGAIGGSSAGYPSNYSSMSREQLLNQL